MKIAIIGAGALGLMFGAKLSQENEVYLLDIDPKTIDAINKDGVLYQDALTKEKEIFHPHACLNGTLKEKVDLVLVLVKTNYTESSLEANRNLIDGKTYFLTLQNGLGNEEKMGKYIDKEHLILGVTRNNSNRFGLNSLCRTNHGVTTLGIKKNNQEICESFQKALNQAGFETVLDSNIRKAIWSKLFLNLACNPLCAYYNVSIGEIESKPEIWEKAKSIIEEAVDVASKEGIHFDKEETVNQIKSFIHGLFEGHPSMWQDVTHKRKTEIMTMNGKVSELGKRYGVPTPSNDWITKKILDMESKF